MMSSKDKTVRSGEEKPVTEAPVQDKPLDREIYDLLGKILDEHGVEKAIFLMEVEGKLGVYYRGHFYDAAQLLSEAHRRFLAKIEKDMIP